MKRLLSAAVLLLWLGGIAQGDAAFDRSMAALSKLGMNTDGFSCKGQSIEVTDQDFKMVFPHNGAIVEAIAEPAHFTYSDGSIYVWNVAHVTRTDREVTVQFKFPLAGEYKIALAFDAEDAVAKAKVQGRILYDITVGKAGADGEIADLRADNFPVIPSGYFYRDGLSMTRVDQKYTFNTARQTWAVRIAGQNGKSLSWAVSRPGTSFDRRNIASRVEADGVTYTFRFPETGVYVLDLHDTQGHLLVRYKVRCTEPATDAVTGSPPGWSDEPLDLSHGSLGGGHPVRLGDGRTDPGGEAEGKRAKRRPAL